MTQPETIPGLQSEEGRIIEQAGRVLDSAGVIRDGHVIEARIGLLVVERDRLRREWDRVVTALGPYASPAESPSDNVTDLVQVFTLLDQHVRRMDALFGEIVTIVEEHIGRTALALDVNAHHHALTDWERVRMLIAQAGDWVSPVLWKRGPR